MALRLFQADGGYTDGNISYLSGSGAPGGDTSYQDDAETGSVYEDVTAGVKYRKHTAGTGSDKWAVAVAAAENVQRDIEQVSHGFVKGDWVYPNGSGGYAKAQADDALTSDAVGIVDEVVDVDNFIMVTAGFTTVTEASTNGSALFLDSTTAGGHTTTKPEVGIQKNLGFAADGVVFVAINITIEISADDAPGIPLIIESAVTSLQKIDSIVCDDKGGVAWLLTVADDANAQRYTSIIVANHNGTSSADATAADFQEGFEMEMPEDSEIAGLAVGVGLTGAGATQEMELQVAATNTCKVTARRMAN